MYEAQLEEFNLDQDEPNFESDVKEICHILEVGPSEVATEGFKDTVKSIWDYIVKTFAKIYEYIKKTVITIWEKVVAFYKWLSSVFVKQEEKKTSQAKKKADKAAEEARRKAESPKKYLEEYEKALLDIVEYDGKQPLILFMKFNELLTEYPSKKLRLMGLINELGQDQFEFTDSGVSIKDVNIAGLIRMKLLPHVQKPNYGSTVYDMKAALNIAADLEKSVAWFFRFNRGYHNTVSKMMASSFSRKEREGYMAAVVAAFRAFKELLLKNKPDIVRLLPDEKVSEAIEDIKKEVGNFKDENFFHMKGITADVVGYLEVDPDNFRVIEKTRYVEISENQKGTAVPFMGADADKVIRSLSNYAEYIGRKIAAKADVEGMLKDAGVIKTYVKKQASSHAVDKDVQKLASEVLSTLAQMSQSSVQVNHWLGTQGKVFGDAIIYVSQSMRLESYIRTACSEELKSLIVE